MEAIFNTTTDSVATEGENAYETYIRIFQSLLAGTAILGLIGNVFAYLTASNFAQKSSGQNFIKCLAVGDTLAGFQDGILESLFPMLGLDLFVHHTLLCRYMGWFTYFSTVASAYVLVATAVDRLIAVWKPIYYSQNSTPVRATVTSLLVWLLWALICLPVFFTFDVQGDDFCFIVVDNPWSILTAEQLQTYNDFIAMSSATVPGIALIVVNILTLYKLKKNTASVSRNDREVTICLIVVSVSFLICVLATGIMVKHGVDIRDSNPDLAYMINYTRKIPVVINNSMNFYAYFAASAYFRSVFYQTVGLKRSSGGQNGTRGRTENSKT
ncbi:cephalotocin receptor 1-like isoform X2 [Symsagittifera roscoffensis]